MCIMAPMLCAFGLSSLRYVEMGSSRNLLITGLALFLSISVPEYFNTYTLTNGHGPVNTSNAEVRYAAPPRLQQQQQLERWDTGLYSSVL